MLFLQELKTSVEIGLIYGVVAAGIYLTLRAIKFTDMTCDGSFVSGASVSAVAMVGGCNPWLALALAACAGALAGLCTGILSIKLKIGDLFSGIIVAFALYSVNLRVMGGVPNVMLQDVASPGIPTLAIAAVLVAGSLVLMLASGFGLKMRAVGHNKQFAAVYGISANFMTLACLMLSNALVALGGALFCQYQGFCDISQGIGTLVVGLASVVIGEKLLPLKMEPWLVLSCVAGAVFYRILIGIALHGDALGIAAQDLNIVTSVLVVMAMLIKRGRDVAVD